MTRMRLVTGAVLGLAALAVAAGAARAQRAQVVKVGGTSITLITGRADRPVQSPPAPPRAAFSALGAQAKYALLQSAATAEPTVIPPRGVAPSAPPFTLTSLTMAVPGRGLLEITRPSHLDGWFPGVGFNDAQGSVQVVNRAPPAAKYMLHFQLMSMARSAFNYTITTGDGVATTVPASLGLSAPQDIVVVFAPPPNAPQTFVLATIKGTDQQWTFLGVEVTPF